MLIITIKKDNFAYLDTLGDVKLFQLLQRSFTREEKEYNNYYRMYEMRRKLLYTLINNGTIIKVKAGLIPFLCASLNKAKVEYKVIDQRLKITDLPITICTKLNDKVNLRKYQETAVKNIFNEPFSCVQLPTGTGKTEIAASVIKSFLNTYSEFAFLYAVPTCRLQTEAKERFEKYGITVNTEYPIKINAVNVFTFAGLTRASNEKFDYKQRDSIGAVIWDEAHHLSASKLSGVVHKLHNLRLNIGMSATISENLESKNKIYLRDLTSKEMYVYGCTGKIVYNMDVDESIDNNFVVPIEIRVLDNTPAHIVLEDDADWQIIKNVILKDTNRAQLVAGYTHHIVTDANLNTVVLLIPEIEWSKLYMKYVYDIFKNEPSTRIFELHGGEKVYEYIEGKRVYLTNENKKEAFNAIKDPNVRTIFSATTFFFEGIDITNIQAVINCYGGRDSKRIKQQCGRAMRLFKDKNIAYIHEIRDLHNPVLESQFRKRINVYKKEYDAKVIFSSYGKQQ